MAVVRVYSGTGDIAIWYQSHGTAKLGLFCGGLYVRTLDEDDNFSKDFVKSLWKRSEAEAIALKYTGRDLRAQSVSAIRRKDNDVSFFVPVSGDDMGKPVFLWDTTVGVSIAFRLLKRLVVRAQSVSAIRRKDNGLNCLSAVEAIGSDAGIAVHAGILGRSQLPFGC